MLNFLKKILFFSGSLFFLKLYEYLLILIKSKSSWLVVTLIVEVNGFSGITIQ